MVMGGEKGVGKLLEKLEEVERLARDTGVLQNEYAIVCCIHQPNNIDSIINK